MIWVWVGVAWTAVAILTVGFWAIALDPPHSHTVGAPWNRYERCPSCYRLWVDCKCTERWEIEEGRELPNSPERIAHREWN